MLDWLLHGVIAVGGTGLRFTQVGPWSPATGAWILAGSMLATCGTARGWAAFWLAWLLVDVVGVTTLLQAGYLPAPVMYVVYAAFVVVGFLVWRRASEPRRAAPELEEVVA